MTVDPGQDIPQSYASEHPAVMLHLANIWAAEAAELAGAIELCTAKLISPDTLQYRLAAARNLTIQRMRSMLNDYGLPELVLPSTFERPAKM